MTEQNFCIQKVEVRNITSKRESVKQLVEFVIWASDKLGDPTFCYNNWPNEMKEFMGIAGIWSASTEIDNQIYELYNVYNSGMLLEFLCEGLDTPVKTTVQQTLLDTYKKETGIRFKRFLNLVEFVVSLFGGKYPSNEDLIKADWDALIQEQREDTESKWMDIRKLDEEDLKALSEFFKTQRISKMKRDTPFI